MMFLYLTRVFHLCVIMSTTLLGGLFSAFAVPYFQLHGAWSPAMAGAFVSSLEVGAILGSLLALVCLGLVPTSYSRHANFISFIAMAWGGVIHTAMLLPGLELPTLALIRLTAGVGVGVALNAVNLATVKLYPEQTGLMGAMVECAYGAGMSIGAFLSGTVYTFGGFNMVVYVTLGVSVVAAGCGLAAAFMYDLARQEAEASSRQPDEAGPSKEMSENQRHEIDFIEGAAADTHGSRFGGREGVLFVLLRRGVITALLTVGCSVFVSSWVDLLLVAHMEQDLNVDRGDASLAAGVSLGGVNIFFVAATVVVGIWADRAGLSDATSSFLVCAGALTSSLSSIAVALQSKYMAKASATVLFSVFGVLMCIEAVGAALVSSLNVSVMLCEGVRGVDSNEGTAFALVNIVTGVAIVVTPIIGGYAVERWGYPFATSGSMVVLTTVVGTWLLCSGGWWRRKADGGRSGTTTIAPPMDQLLIELHDTSADVSGKPR